MDNQELIHYGVPGMKWGVRKARPSSSGRKTTSKLVKKKTTKVKKKKAKKISEMSEAELNEKIKRLELEKKYRDLDPRSSRNKQASDFVVDVLKNIGKNALVNIGTQAATHALGVAINKAAKVASDDVNNRIVNPQKGQSDKK